MTDDASERTGREIRGLREELARFFDNPLHSLRGALGGLGGPSVEVIEQGGDVVVRAEVPGVDPADLSVRLSERAVVIEGEVRRQHQTEGEGFYHTERRYGAFTRSVPLPCEVNPALARARYRQGLLEVRAPKLRSDPIAGRRLPIEIDAADQAETL